MPRWASPLRSPEAERNRLPSGVLLVRRDRDFLDDGMRRDRPFVDSSLLRRISCDLRARRSFTFAKTLSMDGLRPETPSSAGPLTMELVGLRPSASLRPRRSFNDRLRRGRSADAIVHASTMPSVDQAFRRCRWRGAGSGVKFCAKSRCVGQVQVRTTVRQESRDRIVRIE